MASFTLWTRGQCRSFGTKTSCRRKEFMGSVAFLEAAERGDLSLSHVNEFIPKLGLIRPPGNFLVVAALHKAAEKGHVAIVQSIVMQWPQILLSCTSDELGLTLLHVVARSGQSDVLKALPNKVQDIKVNVRAQGNITPLHLASYGGHVILVEQLLEWQDLNLLATSTTRKGG